MRAFNRPLLLVVLMCAGPVGASGEERKTEESFIPSYNAGSVGYLWGSEADLQDAPGAAMKLHEARVQAHYPWLQGERVRITGGISYRFTVLDFTGLNPFASGDLNLHRLQIPLNYWHSLGGPWKLWVGISPGLFTDFSEVTWDDVAVTALAVGAWEFHPEWSLSFGGYYSRDLGEDRLLPVLGFIWRPDPHWNVSATFPRLRVAYAPDTRWVFEAMVLPGGSGWNYRNPAAGEDLNLEYKSWRAVLGGERLLTDRLPGTLHGYAEVGIGFGQTLTLRRGGDELTATDLDGTLVVSLGLRWRM